MSENKTRRCGHIDVILKIEERNEEERWRKSKLWRKKRNKRNM